MDQAGRIIAGMKGASSVASPERIACGAWKRAVGKRLALRTRAVKLVRDRLVVEVEDEIWRESLWKLRFQILRNIEREIGTEIVSDLQFVVAPPRREPQRETGVETSAAARADEADAIADPGLRRIYRNSRRRLA
jgi:predicted nucleic acid-binding Zn ribbon protein